MHPIVVLAGGASTRMGQPKGLVRLSGRPWLELQLRRLREAGFCRVVLVLGFHSKEYFRESPWVGVQSLHLDLTVDVVVNPKPELGPFSSLQAGIQNIKQTEGIFILPVDVPVPKPIVFQEILNHLPTARQLQNPDVVIPAFQGRNGHPVWISNILTKKIIEMNASSPSARLDFVIRDLPTDRVVRVEVQDSSVVMNLNAPEDFLKYQLNCGSFTHFKF